MGFPKASLLASCSAPPSPPLQLDHDSDLPSPSGSGHSAAGGGFARGEDDKAPQSEAPQERARSWLGEQEMAMWDGGSDEDFTELEDVPATKGGKTM